MALVKDKPKDIPTTNALDQIDDDLLGPIPAEIRLGPNVLMMLDAPPAMREAFTVCARLKVKRVGIDDGGEDGGGEDVHFRTTKLITAWILGKPKPPTPDEDQPALFDANEGAAIEEAKALLASFGYTVIDPPEPEPTEDEEQGSDEGGHVVEFSSKQ